MHLTGENAAPAPSGSLQWQSDCCQPQQQGRRSGLSRINLPAVRTWQSCSNTQHLQVELIAALSSMDHQPSSHEARRSSDATGAEQAVAASKRSGESFGPHSMRAIQGPGTECDVSGDSALVHTAVLGQECTDFGQIPCCLDQPGLLVVLQKGMLGACEVHPSTSDSLLLVACIISACHAPTPSHWLCS